MVSRNGELRKAIDAYLFVVLPANLHDGVSILKTNLPFTVHNHVVTDNRKLHVIP